MEVGRGGFFISRSLTDRYPPPPGYGKGQPTQPWTLACTVLLGSTTDEKLQAAKGHGQGIS